MIKAPEGAMKTMCGKRVTAQKCLWELPEKPVSARKKRVRQVAQGVAVASHRLDVTIRRQGL